MVIAGEGPLRDALAQRRGSGSGALEPARRAARLIEGASVLLVAPSVVARDGSRDGIPTVLKEALALGVPVVASDAVGNPEVVEPEHGALYPAGDRAALREALTAILARDDREAMGRAGRAFAEQHADVAGPRSAARLWRDAVPPKATGRGSATSRRTSTSSPKRRGRLARAQRPQRSHARPAPTRSIATRSVCAS